MLNPSTWIVVYLALLVVFSILGARRDGEFDPLSAQTLFNVPAALYSLGAAINHHWLGVDLWRYGYQTTADYIEQCLPLTVVALVAFNVAYLVCPGGRLGSRLPGFHTSQTHDQVLGHWGLGTMLVAWALTMVGFSYFGLANVFGSPYGTLAMAQQSLIHTSMFLESGATLAAAYLLKYGRWSSPFGMLVGGTLIGYLGFVVLLGKRAALLYVFLSLLLLRHMFRKRISLVAAVAGSVPLVALLIFVEVGRASPVRTPQSMAGHFSYMASESSEFAEWRDWPARVLGQGDNLGTLGVIMERTPDVIEFQYGWTYIEAVFRLMPGFLWRGLFSQGLSTLAGENLAFFYLAEAYLNFGWVGILIVPALLGTGLRVLDNWRDRYRQHMLVAVLFAVMAGGIAYLPRLDLGSVLKDLVYRPAFLLVLYVLSMAFVRHASPAGRRLRIGGNPDANAFMPARSERTPAR